MKIVKLLLRAFLGWKWPLKLGRTGKVAIIIFVALHLALFAVLLMPDQTQAHMATTRPAAQQTQTHTTQQSGQPNASCNGADPLYYDNNCFIPSIPGTKATGSASWKDGSIQSPFGQKSNVLFFVTDVKITIQNAGVITMWKGSLWIVDICMVVLLMLNGLRIILVGSIFRYADVVEALPKVFIALICAHISFFFAISLIGLDNNLSYDIYQWANRVNPETQIITVVGEEESIFPQEHPDCVMDHADWRLTTYYWRCPVPPISIIPPNLNFNNIFDNIGNLFDIGNLFLKMLGLMLLTQLIIRMFFIDFYIILSPIGIAASALPGRSGQSLTRLWLSGFLSSIFVQFLQVVALIVIEVLINNMFSTLKGAFDPNFISSDNLQLILQISALWFIVRIPSLLGTAPMSTMVQTGQAMTQAATTIATTQIAEVQAGISAASSVGGAALAFL